MAIPQQLASWLGATSPAGAAFVAFAGASIAWSSGDPVWSATLLLSWAIAYVLGTWTLRAELVWSIYCWSMSIPLTFMVLDQIFDMPVIFNANVFGCALALALAGAVAYGHYWFIPFGLAGVWATHSRGAIIATGILYLIAAWRWYKPVAIGLLALAIVAAFAVSGDQRDGGLWPRMGIWQEVTNHLTVFGSGFGSFFETYWSWPVHINTNANFSRAQHAYNDVLELVFELGIGTILLWVLLILAWEGTDDRAKLVLITFAALGLTFFPLFIPILGQLAAFSVGQLVASRHPKETYYALQT